MSHAESKQVENREQAEIDGEQEEVKEYGDLEHFILEEPDLRIFFYLRALATPRPQSANSFR